MSDMPQWPDWWRAADGKWYPPLPPPPASPPRPLLPLESPETRRARNLGGAALCMGIMGMVFGWLPVFGLLVAWLGPVAVWCGIRALSAARLAAPGAIRSIRTTANVGIVTGAFATGFFVLWGAFWIVSLGQGQDPFRGL